MSEGKVTSCGINTSHLGSLDAGNRQATAIWSTETTNLLAELCAAVTRGAFSWIIFGKIDDCIH